MGVAKSIKKFRWKGRNVLVTGGSGFVGYWLASTLAQKGARVTVLDPKSLPTFVVLDDVSSKNISYVRGLTTSSALVTRVLRTKNIQTIFHLGAEAIVSRAQARPADALDKNIRGTWALLECARTYGKVEELVIASSDKAYGSHPTLPYLETFALQGENPYDCSKSCTDLVAAMYAHAYGLPVVIARCGNIYGGGDLNGTRLLPDAIRCLFTNKVFAIRSNGKFKRDYIYIADIVDAYLTLAENLSRKHLSGEAFNFGNNKPLSVLGALDVLQKAARRKLSMKILNQVKLEIHDQYLNSNKAARLLGWKAQVSHAQGFAATAQWYESFFNQHGKLEA